MPEALMTVAELSEFLQMTPGTIYNKSLRGEIPCIHFNRRSLRFRRSDIEKWVEEHSVSSNEQLMARIKENY